MVADHAPIIQQITIDDLGPLDGRRRDRAVHADLFCTLAGVLFGLFFADRMIVDDDVIKIDLRSILPDDLEVMSRLKAAFGASEIFNPGKVFPTSKGCGEVSSRMRAAIARVGADAYV